MGWWVGVGAAGLGAAAVTGWRVESTNSGDCMCWCMWVVNSWRQGAGDGLGVAAVVDMLGLRWVVVVVRRARAVGRVVVGWRRRERCVGAMVVDYFGVWLSGVEGESACEDAWRLKGG